MFDVHLFVFSLQPFTQNSPRLKWVKKDSTGVPRMSNVKVQQAEGSGQWAVDREQPNDNRMTAKPNDNRMTIEY